MTVISGDYMLLTTFRKSGVGAPTPVWFAESGGKLYVYCDAESGKAKRVRTSSRIEACRCSVGGRPRGPVIAGEARVLPDDQREFVHDLLNRKYGWKKALVGMFSKIPTLLHLRKEQPEACLEITLRT